VESEATLPVADWFGAVYAAVRAVPPGCVATYGQVADMVEGYRLTARQVGTALRWAPRDVPWQRVVGAGGRLPIAKRSPELQSLQRNLLRGEGVRFVGSAEDRVDMAAHQVGHEG